jgi:DNA-binding transcriptional ArsR family regulator
VSDLVDAAARDDSIAALVALTGLDQSTLSRNLHRLERAGLVEITIIEKDLRRCSGWAMVGATPATAPLSGTLPNRKANPAILSNRPSRLPHYTDWHCMHCE